VVPDQAWRGRHPGARQRRAPASVLKPEQAGGPLQAHTLAINEVGLAFTRAARRHDHEFDSRSWRHEIVHDYRVGKHRRRVITDAVLIYSSWPEGEAPYRRYWFLELDRGNSLAHTLADRLSRYTELLDVWEEYRAEWRVEERLGYEKIRDRLNADLTAYLPPVNPNPRQRCDVWTTGSITHILANPKYTGYSVWNRRGSKSKPNPPSAWIWSVEPARRGPGLGGGEGGVRDVNRDELHMLLEGLRGLPYDGEPVDQLTHALQAAGHALAAGADDELVLAALLHDVSRAEPVTARHPGLGHDEAGRLFVTALLGERPGWLVGQHAEAKRYLVTAEPTYRHLLSQTSVRTLAEQGGPMTPGEAAAFAAHPWAADAIRLRRWDDLAKAPGAPAPTLDELLSVYERARAR
jgi:predicted HD phosphohydrolase